MELLKIEPTGATVQLDPGDCAKLARFCRLAEDGLAMAETGGDLDAARLYGAAFQALAMAGAAPASMLKAQAQSWYDGLAALGLGDVIDLGPMGKQG